MSDDVKIRIKIDADSAEIDVKQLADALNKLGVESTNANAKAQKGFKDSGAAIKGAKTEAQGLAGALNDFTNNQFKSTNSIINSVNGITNAFGQLRKNINDSGSAFKTSFLANLGANLAGNAITGAFNFLSSQIAESVREAREFARAVAEINSVLPQNNRLTQEASKTFSTLSRAYATSPTSQAKAFYAIVESGTEDVATALQTLRAANIGALGSQTDLESFSRILTTTLNVYAKSGLDAATATDIIAKTIDEGAVKANELSTSLSKATFNANTVGVSFKEVGASLAFLTRQGQSTSTATTSLANLFSAFTKQVPQSVDNFSKLNTEFKGMAFNADTIANSGGLLEFFRKLREDGNATKEVVAKIFPDERGRRAAFAILENFDQFEQSFNKLENSAGAAQIALKKITDGDAFKFDKAKAEVDALQVKLGQQLLPAIKAVLTGWSQIISLFSDPAPTTAEVKISQLSQALAGLDAEIQSRERSLQRAKESGDQKEAIQQEKELNVLKSERNKLDSDLKPIKAQDEQRKALRELNQEYREQSKVLKDMEEQNKNGNFVTRVLITDAQVQGVKDNLKAIEDEIKRVKSNKIEFPIKVVPEGDNKNKGEVELSDDEKERIKQKAEKRARAIREANAQAERNEALTLENAGAEENLERETDIMDLETKGSRRGYLTNDEFTQLQELQAAQFDTKQNLEFEQEEARIARLKDAKQRELEIIKLQNKQQLEATKFYGAQVAAADKQRTSTTQENLSATAGLLNGFTQIAAAAGDDYFELQRALTLATIPINVAAGIMKAQELGYPANIIQSAAVVATGIAQTIQVTSQKKPKRRYREGGIHNPYGGSISGDNSIAALDDREMIMNVADQQELYYAIKTGSFGGGNEIIISYLARIADANETNRDVYFGVEKVSDELRAEAALNLKV